MIVDGHCHYDRTSVEELLRTMDRYGVGKAVICPSGQYIVVDNRQGNKRTAKAVKAHSDRFIGFAVANPWYGKRAIGMLEEAWDLGLVGLKFNSSLQGFLIHDSLVFPLVEWARKHKWPVYFHTGTPIHSLPFQLGHLAKKYPECNFIMGHMGFADAWTDALVAAEMSPNIYLETSLFLVLPKLREACEKFGAERVIFGSDFPTAEMGLHLEKMVLCVPDGRERELVLGGNILRLIA